MVLEELLFARRRPLLQSGAPMFEDVEFPSEGAVLRGRLYRPATDGSPPIVVMANGTSATISIAMIVAATKSTTRQNGGHHRVFATK